MVIQVDRFRWVVPALACTLLVGCGGGDDDEPNDPFPASDSSSSSAPTSAPTSTSSAPAPVSDEQALRKLMRGYERALARISRTRAAEGSLDGVATPEFADQVLSGYRTNIYGEGMEIFGDYEIEFGSAKVDGDQAEVIVCSDGRDVYIVEEGQRIPEGATGQLRVPSTFEAVRGDSGWLLDDVTSGRREC